MQAGLGVSTLLTDCGAKWTTLYSKAGAALNTAAANANSYVPVAGGIYNVVIASENGSVTNKLSVTK